MPTGCARLPGYSAPAPAQDARPATNLKHKARDEDLANSGTRRISNVIVVRTLYPIEDVLADPTLLPPRAFAAPHRHAVEHHPLLQ